MALGSYSELRTTIADYLARDGDIGFVNMIPSFVKLCETRMNRALRDLENEYVARLTPDENGQALLPLGFRQLRMVNCEDSAPGLEYLTPAEAESRYGDASGGTPVAYSIVGQTLFLYPASTTSVILSYYGEVPALSDSRETNWVLEKHPDAYLFGSLVEACLFAGMDDPRIAAWEQKFAAAIDDIRTSDRGARWGNARAQVPGGVLA